MIQFDYSKHEEPDWHAIFRGVLVQLIADPATRKGAADAAAGITDYAMYLQRLRFSEVPRPTAIEVPDPVAPVVDDVPLDEPPLSERPPAPESTEQLDPELVRDMAQADESLPKFPHDPYSLAAG